MSDIYVVVPEGWTPPPAHTTWQGAAAEIVGKVGVEVVNIELMEDDDG